MGENTLLQLSKNRLAKAVYEYLKEQNKPMHYRDIFDEMKIRGHIKQSLKYTAFLGFLNRQLTTYGEYAFFVRAGKGFLANHPSPKTIPVEIQYQRREFYAPVQRHEGAAIKLLNEIIDMMPESFRAEFSTLTWSVAEQFFRERKSLEQIAKNESLTPVGVKVKLHRFRHRLPLLFKKYFSKKYQPEDRLNELEIENKLLSSALTEQELLNRILQAKLNELAPQLAIQEIETNPALAVSIKELNLPIKVHMQFLKFHPEIKTIYDLSRVARKDLEPLGQYAVLETQRELKKFGTSLRKFTMQEKIEIEPLRPVPIDELDLPARFVNNYLNHHPEIKTILDLTLLSVTELMQTENLGAETIRLVRMELKGYGADFKL